MFALDTNAVIHAFKRKGNVHTRLTAVRPSQIAIPAVALYELQRGVLASQNPAVRRAQLDALVSVVQVLPFDAHAASLAALIRVHLERQFLVHLTDERRASPNTVSAYGRNVVQPGQAEEGPTHHLAADITVMMNDPAAKKTKAAAGDD